MTVAWNGTSVTTMRRHPPQMNLQSRVDSDRPAILGAPPCFDELVPIVRPVLPAFSEMEADYREIFESRIITRGKHLEAFEEAVAASLQAKHVVAVSSGTCGLVLTYLGLGMTGEVIVPSFTFLATVGALVRAGARPVFVDVEPDTQNLDPEAVGRAITPRTTGIVAVHNFGNPAAIDSLQAVARRHHLKLVFDAAHAFGSLYQGSPVGGQPDAQVFSLSPTKLLIAGEGGIVATGDDQLAEYVRRGREYGMAPGYDSLFAGLNARMSELHAVLGLHSMQMLEAAVARRQELAKLYQESLSDVPGIGFQTVRPGDRSSFKDFSITVDPEAFGLPRDDLAGALRVENIDTRAYWNPPVHRQTAYQCFAPSEDLLQNTVLLAQRSLSLPLWSQMDEQIVLRIAAAIRSVHLHADELAEAIGAGDR